MTDQVQKPYTISFSFQINTERSYTQATLVGVHVHNESVPESRDPEAYLNERIREELTRKFNESLLLPRIGMPVD